MRVPGKINVLLLLSLAVLACGACAADQAYVELKGRRFSVEIADDDGERGLGLMFRDSMPADHGMLFIFPGEAYRSFWMKNTRIPLDILYFNRELELVSVAENARPCRVARCPGYPSEGPAQYVLELNAGMASEIGVSAGDALVLELD
ncbi:MAG: DUF192 domain-containing protein [Xanthomonadales bacterium]|nr:DUF192 domain-containing protein [Xanthomonadales bacterium]NIX13045.1 DUF192 domain-containing protein [Xanthomonadales bacterium]